MIPDAAVEAAAAALWQTDQHDDEWVGEFPEYMDYLRSEATKALEAAAPHMLAEAWAQGAQAGFDATREGFNGECAFEHCAPDNYPPTNPYNGEPWEVADYDA